MKRYSIITLITLSCCFFSLNVHSQLSRRSVAQSTVTNLENNKWRINLSPKDRWFDTGIYVTEKTVINVSASGSVTWSPPGGRNMSPTVGPNGTRLPFDEDKNRFPLPTAGCGSLIMRVNDSMYFIGERNSVKIDKSGNIQLMVNDDVLSDNSGSFSVDINISQNISSFRKPIDRGSIACVFDTKNCADKSKYHTGIDYWGEDYKATDILASNCGTVSFIQRNGENDHGLGNAVILKHSVIDEATKNLIDRYTLYGHLSSINSNLKIEQKVVKGEILGVMGSTGYGELKKWGKTPHLHFEVKTENTLANSIKNEIYWGYTPQSAANFGYFNPDEVIKNWQAVCSEQEYTTKTPFRKQIEVQANKMWVDTGIDITDRSIRIEYVSGRWSNGGDRPIYSDARGGGSWKGLLVPDAPFRSLVGKTSNGTFHIGNLREGSFGQGRLYLSINDVPGTYFDNLGSITVVVSSID